MSFLGEHRDEILFCIAGAWLPMKVAREHYRACNRLELSDDEYLAITRTGAEARAPGATPWTAFTLTHRGWSRACDGGAVGIYALGEKRARLEFVGCELFDIPYFRRAVRFMIYLMAWRSAEDLRVVEAAESAQASCIYLVSWK